MQEEITIQTSKPKEVVDITDEVNQALPAQSGICHLFVLHTTVALSCADLDPGTDLDMLDAFEAMVPQLDYRHPHDPSHVPDHILSAMIGTSLAVPVLSGRLRLGRWQRVVLFEFNGPRQRSLMLSLMSTAM
jgi:secondary thiamine-phosphate synthase enzyme